MQFNVTEYKNMTNVSDTNIKMGLNNTVCNNPKYFCMSHKIYLSPEDVQEKHCLQKMSADMLSTQKCRWLIETDKYEEMIEKKNEIIQNNRRSKLNNVF